MLHQVVAFFTRRRPSIGMPFVAPCPPLSCKDMIWKGKDILTFAPFGTIFLMI
jgi:hypothetical protein